LTANEFVTALVTVPNRETALKIARELVNARLAACANIIPSIASVYRWEGKICEEGEELLVIKTRQELFDDLSKLVKSLHPYTVPEIIALPILAGNPDYLRWIKTETTVD